MATLAELVSQHAVVTHRAVAALQKEEQERRQQQPQRRRRRQRRQRSCWVRKVKRNASKCLQISYDHYKCLAINKNGLHLLMKMLQKQSGYVYLANFRSMFLIFVTPNMRNTPWSTANAFKHLRMSSDHLVIIANWWRIAFVSPFATTRQLMRTALRKCCEITDNMLSLWILGARC